MAIELARADLDLNEYGSSEVILLQRISSLKEIPKNFDPQQAILIDTNNLEEARKIIDKLHGKAKRIIVSGRDASFNRKILENKKVNILLNPEKYGKSSSLYQQDSGLNHILCKIAKENKIAIAVDIKELAQKEGKEQAKYLAKALQNIKLCKKYQVPYLLTTLPSNKEEARSAYDLKALARVLGMDTKMAQEAVEKTFLK